ncbi:MAG: hypothetical protein ABWZ57_13555 [Mesorhizobium sp.]
MTGSVQRRRANAFSNTNRPSSKPTTKYKAKEQKREIRSRNDRPPLKRTPNMKFEKKTPRGNERGVLAGAHRLIGRAAVTSSDLEVLGFSWPTEAPIEETANPSTVQKQTVVASWDLPAQSFSSPTRASKRSSDSAQTAGPGILGAPTPRHTKFLALSPEERLDPLKSGAQEYVEAELPGAIEADVDYHSSLPGSLFQAVGPEGTGNARPVAKMLLELVKKAEVVNKKLFVERDTGNYPTLYSEVILSQVFGNLDRDDTASLLTAFKDGKAHIAEELTYLLEDLEAEFLEDDEATGSGPTALVLMALNMIENVLVRNSEVQETSVEVQGPSVEAKKHKHASVNREVTETRFSPGIPVGIAILDAALQPQRGSDGKEYADEYEKLGMSLESLALDRPGAETAAVEEGLVKLSRSELEAVASLDEERIAMRLRDLTYSAAKFRPNVETVRYSAEQVDAMRDLLSHARAFAIRQLDN